jgi:hypothetical protein
LKNFKKFSKILKNLKKIEKFEIFEKWARMTHPDGIQPTFENCPIRHPDGWPQAGGISNSDPSIPILVQMNNFSLKFAIFNHLS